MLAWFDRSTRPDDPDNGTTCYHRDRSRISGLDDEWTAMQVSCDHCEPHNRVISKLEIEEKIAEHWAPDRRHARLKLPV